MLFPRRMHGKETLKRQQSIQSGHLPAADKNIKYSFKGYFLATFKLVLNKVFMFAILALAVRLIFSVGMVTFIIKVMILKFGIEPSKAGSVLGIALAPTLIGKL